MTEEAKPVPEDTLLLRREDSEDLLDRAAERGAERCLAHLGLENGSAVRDIRELRDLLEAWHAVVKAITTGLFAALLVGAAIEIELMGSAQ